MKAFFATRSTTPRNVLLLADRQLDRDDRAVARLRGATASDRSRLARSRSSRLTHDEARQPELARRPPTTFSVCTITPATASTTTRAASATCSAARASLRKLPMPGRVDQVDLLLVPLGVGEAGRERVLAGDFLFVEVGDRRAVVDLAEAVDHAGVEEDGGGELRLARSAVADESDVPDAGGVVDLHRTGPPIAHCGSRSLPRIICGAPDGPQAPARAAGYS